MIDCEKVTEKIVQFMQDYVKSAKADGIVLGVSGGVDSAVVYKLAQRAFPVGKVYTIWMPEKNVDSQDAKDVKELLRNGVAPKDFAGLPSGYFHSTEEIGAHALSFVSAIVPKKPMTSGNIKARCRMMILYAYANEHNLLVAGTTNKTEMYIGYFTKHGDGACDLEPISGLHKTEVWELAKYLGVPDSIVKKAPSAGLYHGQTDESEIGMTYAEMDAQLMSGIVTAPKLVGMHRATMHKRTMPPGP